MAGLAGCGLFFGGGLGKTMNQLGSIGLERCDRDSRSSMKTGAGIGRRLGFYSNGGVDVHVTTMFSRGFGKAAGV